MKKTQAWTDKERPRPPRGSPEHGYLSMPFAGDPELSMRLGATPSHPQKTRRFIR